MSPSLAIQDYSGSYFYPDATCFRHDWSDLGLKTDSDLDHCFSWKVVLSDDKLYYRLVSRPLRYDIPLTQELGSFLHLYREAGELAPEKYPEQWLQLRQTGWDVIAEHCDPAALRVCNRKRNINFIVDSIPYEYRGVSNDFGAHFWNIAVFQATRYNNSLAQLHRRYDELDKLTGKSAAERVEELRRNHQAK